ncbi:MAG: hypothetical protein ABR562_07905 [Thermoplasmatota archaeon]
MTAQITSSLHVVVAAGDCTDKFNAQIMQPAAVIGWRLSRRFAGEAQKLANGTFTCADATSGLDVAVARYPAPNLGLVEAKDGEAAWPALWSNPTVTAQNETAGYELSLTWSRPGRSLECQPPLPDTQFCSSLSLKVGLRADAWFGTLTQQPAPVVQK